MKILHAALGAILAQAAVSAEAIILPGASEMALAPRTQIMLAPAQNLSSKTLRRGDRFDVLVARDVMVGGSVVIPRGARGHGIVSWRTGRASFGKSGKFEFDLTDIIVGGRVVPVQGRYRIEGRGNTAAVAIAWAAAGVLAAALVTGRSAVAGADESFSSFTTAPMPVSLPGYPATLAGRPDGGQLLVSAGAPALRAAASPSGYCYDVPRDYAGTGSAKFPVLSRLTPACWEAGGR